MPYNLDKVVSFMVRSLGKRYDYFGVIFLGLMKLLRLKNTENKFQKNKDYFCSEFLCLAFRTDNIHITDKSSGVASPADIANSKITERRQR